MKIAARLHKMLSEGISGNQTQLVGLLKQRGVTTTQSTVSRALKRINAVKGVDENGNTIYSLPKTIQGLKDTGFFESLVSDIKDNGQLIVVRTRPGTANTVAKFIDDHGFESVLGSVAGDDTIMIIPADVDRTRQVAKSIHSYLKGIGIL